MMTCEGYRETVLEVATDTPTRSRIAAALAHVDGCDQCRAVLADFDQIAAGLHLNAPGDQPGGESGPAPTGGWEAFDQRMSQFGEWTQNIGQRSRWRDPVVSFTGALLVAVIAFWFGQRSLSGSFSEPSAKSNRMKSVAANLDPPGFSAVARSSQPFSLESSDVVHDTAAFAQVSQVFEGRAGWILVSDSTASSSSPGLGLSPKVIDTDRSVDVLRLTLLRGSQVVSSLDLVIVPGQSADLTVKLPEGKSVHYRAGTVSGNDGRLNLLAEIRPAGDDRPVGVLCTTLDMQADGQIIAGELETASGRYELCSALSHTKLPMQ